MLMGSILSQDAPIREVVRGFAKRESAEMLMIYALAHKTAPKGFCDAVLKFQTVRSPSIEWFEEVHYATRAAHVAGCAGQAPSKVQKTFIKLMKEESIHKLYHAVGAVTHFKKLEETVPFAVVLEKVVGQINAEKGNAKDFNGKTNMAITARAYSIIADLLPHVDLSKGNSAARIREGLQTLMYNKKVLQAEPKILALFVLAYVRIEKQLKLERHDRVPAIAELLISHASIRADEAAGLSMVALHELQYAHPGFVLQKPSNKGPEITLEAEFCSIVGEELEKSAVVLKRANGMRDDVEFTKKGCHFSATFTAANEKEFLAAGKLEFKLTVAGKTFNVSRSLSGGFALNIAKMAMSVGSSSTRSSAKEVYDGENFPQDITLNDSQHLFFDVLIRSQTGSAEKPSQVALILTLVKGKTKPPHGLPLSKTFHFTTAHEKHELHIYLGGKKTIGWSGTYSLTLVVGDPRMERAILKEFGTVSLVYAQEQETRRVSLPDTEEHEEVVLGELHRHALPLIFHQFKQPEKRPHFLIPFIFLLFIFAVPLPLMYIGLKKAGANFEMIPSTNIRAMVFMILIAVHILILAMYFFFLNLVQTVMLISPFFVTAIFVGNAALCDLRTLRAKCE